MQMIITWRWEWPGNEVCIVMSGGSASKTCAIQAWVLHQCFRVWGYYIW